MSIIELEGEIKELHGSPSFEAEIKAFKELVERTSVHDAREYMLPRLQQLGITMEEFESTVKVSAIAHNAPLGARHSLKTEELIETANEKTSDFNHED